MITFQEVKDAKPEMIYYSVNTVWWTHDPKDLQKGPVPLDSFGSPLFQSTKVDEFLNEETIKTCPTYGKFPIETLMAAHHQNLPALKGFHPRMKFTDLAKLVEEMHE